MAYKTRQAQIIFDYIKQNAHSHLTADDIADGVRAQGVSKTTVYRQLERLLNEGKIRKYIPQEGKSACFQYAEETCHSHFHLKCTECNCLFHLECEYLDEIKSHILEHHLFDIDNSRTVFYGLCRNCAEKKKGDTK